MAQIDHINIVVADLEIAARFYEDVLGLQRGFSATLEGEWIETVTGLRGVRAHCLFMESPDRNDTNVRLELLQYETPCGQKVESNSLPQTPGVRHLAFLVEDIDAFTARLKACGVSLISAPVEVPFAVGAMGRKRLCYFHDPDGTLLEVAAYDGLS